MPDVNGDEADSKDETWCLYDGQLIDDELYFELSKFAAGVRILVLSDSCHSGTVTRDAVRRRRRPPSQRPKTMPDGGRDARLPRAPGVLRQAAERRRHATPASRSSIPTPRWRRSAVSGTAVGASPTSSTPSVILISGCQDNQTSMDGEHNGAFTEQLLKVWNQGGFQGNYGNFHARIRARMPATQSPNLFTLGSAGTFLAQKPFSV